MLRLARDDGAFGRQLTRTTADCAAIEAARQKGDNAPPRMSAEGKVVCTSSAIAMPGPAGLTLRYRTSGSTMGELADFLVQYLGRVVVDRTGLSGDFDVDVAFNPDQSPSAASPDAPISIFTALQEQLGLRLESSRAPVSILVADNAEMPTPD